MPTWPASWRARVVPSSVAERRLALWFVLCCVVLWSTLVAISPDAARRHAVGLTAAASFRELAALTDASERQPQAVYLVSDGGVGWVHEELAQVLAATPTFVEGGAHPLHVQVLSVETMVVVRSSLVRRSWALRPPHDWRMRLQPWLPLACLTAGLVVAWVWQRVLAGVVLAGASALACVLWLPWPLPLGIGSESFAVQRGLRIVLATTPDAFVPWGAAIIALALLGVYFDARRPRTRRLEPTTVLASLLLGLPAALAWVEAAWTCGLFAWWTSGLGFVAWPVATCAWIIVARRATKPSRA